MTGQYYLRVRYYNPVIARFTQEDTYYGDGLNIYTYCRNNLILNHDPTGHGTKENSPYSRKEQQYIDAGADPDTARLAAECYPDANSKQDLYNKYKSQGYNATDAKKLANYEIVHGEERAKNYAANNVKKSGSDYTATSPRENPNTDWRTQNRLNAQREAGAGKSGSSADLGNKLDYQFGKAGGNRHNIDRTNGLKAEMDKLGFNDTAENRAYFEQYYNDVLNSSNNIVGVPETASYIENGVTHYYTVTTRESFLMGKYGGAKVTTYWDGNRLLTIKIGSGKQTRYNH